MLPATTRVSIIGFLLMIQGVLFLIGENIYFGWHLFPKTIFEGSCDVVCITMWLFGIRLIRIVVRELDKRSKYYKP
jgi:hypothetical protein